MEKTRAENIGDPSCFFRENIEYGINLHPQARNGNLVIRDQHLSTNMKWKFGIEYGINTFQKT